MRVTELDAVLADCLGRMAQGESAATCLEHYPQHAAELEPVLSTLTGLRELGGYRLPAAARERARARMRGQLVARNARSSYRWRGWAQGLAGLTVTAVLFVTMGYLVMASAPGAGLYRYRTAAERVPAVLAPRPEARIAAEFRAAERRLAELEQAMEIGDSAVGQVVAALWASDISAAQNAAGLAEPARAAVGERIASHAAIIGASVGQGRDEFERAELATVQSRLEGLAADLEMPKGPAPLKPSAYTPTATATSSRTPGPSATPHAPSAGAAPQASRTPLQMTAAPIGTPAPLHTPEPSSVTQVPAEGRRTRTPAADSASMTPDAPQAMKTPVEPRSTQAPRSTATPRETDTAAAPGATHEPGGPSGPGSGGAPDRGYDGGGSGPDGAPASADDSSGPGTG